MAGLLGWFGWFGYGWVGVCLVCLVCSSTSVVIVRGFIWYTVEIYRIQKIQEIKLLEYYN